MVKNGKFFYIHCEHLLVGNLEMLLLLLLAKEPIENEH